MINSTKITRIIRFVRALIVRVYFRLQVWNKNPVMDEFMGKHVFAGVVDKEGFMSEVGLKGKKEGDAAKPGRLFVEITSKTNLVQL